ncbi:MAG: VWA domain-containing protein [Candidatus Woesearchaeota archaeon]
MLNKIPVFLPKERRKAGCQGNEENKAEAEKKDKKKKLNEFSELDTVEKSKKGSNKLMNSLAKADKKTIDNGKLLKCCLDYGVKGFTPDLMMEKFVENYKLAKQIYGESLLRYLSGYDPRYIEKNINIPEFQREIMGKVKEKILDLKAEGLLGKDNSITEQGIELASLILYTEEISNLTPKGILGDKFHKKNYIYGEKTDVKDFKKKDRYKDIALRKSIKSSIRRGHDKLHIEDLKSFEREAKGKIYIVYALDSSGSMKGDKIAMCKKAGAALAFKAIEEKDQVGLIVFGKKVRQKVMPTDDFMLLLREMATIRASSETNLASTIKESIDMFPNIDVTKHLLLLTDALPTFAARIGTGQVDGNEIGQIENNGMGSNGIRSISFNSDRLGINPEEETITAAAIAASHGITISIVGINMNKKGEKLAKKIVEIGSGKLYVVKDVKEIDKIVLEDYYGI